MTLAEITPFTQNLILAAIPTLLAIGGAILNSYYKLKTVTKELTLNTKEDEKTREKLELLQTEHKLLKQQVKEVSDSREEDTQYLKTSLNTLINKIDKLFEKKKEYIDSENEKTIIKMMTEVNRLESLRKEDIIRFSDMFKQVSRSNENVNDSVNTVIQQISELRGVVNLLAKK